MTEAHSQGSPTGQDGFSLANIGRSIIAAFLAAAFIALVVVLAAFLAAASLVIAGIGIVVFGAFWLYQKVRGKSGSRRRGPTVLMARRDADGWTVDGA